LKLKCDETLSNFAFIFKLRRYNLAGFTVMLQEQVGPHKLFPPRQPTHYEPSFIQLTATSFTAV
jgi:hypothetical protein